MVTIKKQKMNPNQKEIGQRFASLSNAGGIAEIIESKSLVNLIKIADDARIPLVHDKILFSTISQSHETLAPEMILLSMLGRFELNSAENKTAHKENKIFQI